jgi:hypothetical protein
VASYAFFELVGAVYYLLAGVLVGNIWEAWRRVNARTGGTFPKGLGFSSVRSPRGDTVACRRTEPHLLKRKIPGVT